MSHTHGGRRAQRHNPANRTTQGRKKQLSLFATFALDFLGGGLLLVVFALFDHVIKFPTKQPQPINLLPSATIAATLNPTPTAGLANTPGASQTAQGQPDDTPTPAPVVFDGMWGEKFADKFVKGDAQVTENGYVSERVNVSYQRVEQDGVVYYLADIYLADIQYFKTAFAGGKWGGGTAPLEDIARENNAIVAISGDHYTGRSLGVEVRNGVLYRDSRFQDVCVMYADGVIETMHNADFDLDRLNATHGGILQAWSFGPMLLENGQPIAGFGSDVTTVNPANPRTALGYVEPGHYIFVQVEGRRDGFTDSRGMTLVELAGLMHSLGCTAAYNMDGGASAAMAWQGELITHNYRRNLGDIIYITDDPAQ